MGNKINQTKNINKMVNFLKTKAEFDETIKTGVTIIDFTASWCPPCKMIGPIFEQFAKEHESANYKFVKIDVDENEEAAGACGIECMPTFQVFKDGVKVDEMKGANQEKLKELVEKSKP